jgi:hypothetical protein
MGRALRIASELAVWGFVIVIIWWPNPPRAVALLLGLAAVGVVSLQIAFRLHDTNQARRDGLEKIR